MACPDENQLLGYALGGLAPAAVASLEDHVDRCAACCELLAHFARGTATTDGAPDDATAPGMQVAARDMHAAGDTLGRYVILNPVGAGGMGVVYAAFDPELDRKIAIKVIRREHDADVTSAQTRLAREARAAAKLTHPNVVVVHDVGTVDGELFIAMELVAGGALSDWLAAERRGVREIIATFARAGRGLAAAHDAGLVHRDFKPHNVLISGDGQVRVSDFGLAASAASTDVQAIAGTPAYMSPEQRRGDVPGPASDQYSFCVALHEAVFGVRPPATTPHTRAPAWLRRLLARGLAHDPRARHPSMTALVDALERGLATRRRRATLAAIAVAMLVTGSAVARSYATSAAGAPTCADASARLDGTWDATTRTRIAAAFGASSRRYASTALTATTGSLDHYATDWVAGRRDACEAANVRHDQSAEVLDLRMICLDRHLSELHALAELLTRADDRVIEKSAAAAAALPPIAECADVERLRMPVRPPADPILRARVAGVRQRIAELEQLDETDQTKLAFARAGEVAVAATQTGDRPAIASALQLLGTLHAELGHTDQAATTLEQAELAAEAAGDIPLAARICSALISAAREQHHADAAHAWGKRALALVERLGGDSALESSIQQGLSNVLETESKVDDARTAAQRALELAERAFGPDDARIVGVLIDVAGIDSRTQRLADARDKLERARTIAERRHGPWHTAVANVVGEIAEVDAAVGAYDDGIREASQALEIFVQAYGDDHPAVAFELGSLADLERAAGHLHDAELHASRAIAIAEKVDGPDDPQVADLVSVMATIALDRGENAAAAPLYRRALAIREQAFGADSLDVASSLNEVAQTIHRLHHPADAIPLYQRALAIEEHAIGATSPMVSVPLTGLGEAYLALHDPAHAAPPLERAIALQVAAQSTKPFDLAVMQFDLAQAVWPSAPGRARDLAVTAHEVFAASGFEGRRLAERSRVWIAAHPATR